MSLTYYYFPMSQPSRAVLAFLELSDIKHEKKVINILTGEQKNPEYLKVNPNGTVPAIDDAGFIVFESEAIWRYLANTQKGGEKLYPADPKIRAAIDRYFPFHHTIVRPAFMKYFKANFAKLFGVADFASPAEVEPEVKSAIEKFESVYLGDNKYISGDKLSIADLFAMGEMTMIFYTTKFDFSKYPKTKAYIEKFNEDPILAKINEPVTGFLESLKKQQEGQAK